MPDSANSGARTKPKRLSQPVGTGNREEPGGAGSGGSAVTNRQRNANVNQQRPTVTNQTKRQTYCKELAPKEVAAAPAEVPAAKSGPPMPPSEADVRSSTYYSSTSSTQPSAPQASKPVSSLNSDTNTFTSWSQNLLSLEPEQNSCVIDEGEIVYRDYIDISVAVATPKGLVVPVIRNTGKMNYADIEKAIHALGEKARTGALAIEDMDGGTFTISNGGVFGSLFGTPIINPPQSAILGMHAIVEQPVSINRKVEIRPIMKVALTYDHRLIDGREGVLFLRKIKQAVEDPVTMLLGI
ncbi:Dihydrolipoyllysine-residue succinyltransferase component of 2-oxoglutarate dehydrogenase complex, mitochondrial [Araneus ventricosus]|uniref:Dihydrolipoyllysine-residue succinyltransferase component of 2-oxoglutarate dehydrogenase complex, mitochondrial n=1 Tax=Araneus ventricosus TaxID=182803 RepID=A0A4Y2GTX2_ARAVE|nr:Dihydrolipoyllysine-residue succinyltransferase component of 2-oxoglutarate dehydrogenase complex, mitochondrial [Araneus ventricosus]